MSMAFQEKLGFVKEGILRREYFFGGEYVDGIDYAMLREEYLHLYGESNSAR
jgi:RimJ/RimL family protein N-acetyltransferase